MGDPLDERSRALEAAFFPSHASDYRDAIRLREQELCALEPTADSEAAWGSEVSGIANATLFPRTDSWWTGANIPGKPRYFSAHLIGSFYYHRISEVAAKDYEGFVFEPARRVE